MSIFSWKKDGDRLTREGETLADQGKYDEALVLLSRALEAAPGDWELWLKKALAQKAMGSGTGHSSPLTRRFPSHRTSRSCGTRRGSSCPAEPGGGSPSLL